MGGRNISAASRKETLGCISSDEGFQSSPRLASILVFHTCTSGILKLYQDDNENSQDVSKAVKCVRNKIKDLSKDKLPPILIANMVTSIVSKKPSDLLIDLGILVRNKNICIITVLFVHTKKLKGSNHQPHYKITKMLTVPAKLMLTRVST